MEELSKELVDKINNLYCEAIEPYLQGPLTLEGFIAHLKSDKVFHFAFLDPNVYWHLVGEGRYFKIVVVDSHGKETAHDATGLVVDINREIGSPLVRYLRNSGFSWVDKVKIEDTEDSIRPKNISIRDILGPLIEEPVKVIDIGGDLVLDYQWLVDKLMPISNSHGFDSIKGMMGIMELKLDSQRKKKGYLKCGKCGNNFHFMQSRGISDWVCGCEMDVKAISMLSVQGIIEIAEGKSKPWRNRLLPKAIGLWHKVGFGYNEDRVQWPCYRLITIKHLVDGNKEYESIELETDLASDAVNLNEPAKLVRYSRDGRVLSKEERPNEGFPIKDLNNLKDSDEQRIALCKT